MNQQEITKEEILQDFFNEYRYASPLNDQTIKPILKAMDDWAKQVAIDFLCWADGKGFQCDLHTDENVKIWQAYDSKPYYSTEELYNLYLKQKQK